jgi:hypothetical protein
LRFAFRLLVQFAIIVNPSKNITQRKRKAKAKKKGGYGYMHKDECRKIFFTTLSLCAFPFSI